MKDAVRMFLEHARRMRATNSIVVNTFDKLDSHVVRSSGRPQCIPQGPYYIWMVRLKRRLMVAAAVMASLSGLVSNHLHQWFSYA